MNVTGSRRRAIALAGRQSVADTIITVRDQRVILATDLAAVYSVTTKALNQAVRRNIQRFPPDFAFRLTKREASDVQRIRSQSVTLKRGAHFKYAPMACTEHGAVMVATVLNSRRAAHMSVFVVRAFLKLREWAAVHIELSRRLSTIEQRVGVHDQELNAIIRAVRELAAPPDPPRRRIGFLPADKGENKNLHEAFPARKGRALQSA